MYFLFELQCIGLSGLPHKKKSKHMWGYQAYNEPMGCTWFYQNVNVHKIHKNCACCSGNITEPACLCNFVLKKSTTLQPHICSLSAVQSSVVHTLWSCLTELFTSQTTCLLTFKQNHSLPLTFIKVPSLHKPNHNEDSEVYLVLYTAAIHTKRL